MLNVSFKILSKLLARRLEVVLPSIVSLDQTGFIRDRHSFSSLRKVFNVIYNPPPSNALPEALIALDAEKAFDRVEWDYLFSLWGNLDLGKNLFQRLGYCMPLLRPWLGRMV